jgi:hypothetical protein
MELDLKHKDDNREIAGNLKGKNKRVFYIVGSLTMPILTTISSFLC